MSFITIITLVQTLQVKNCQLNLSQDVLKKLRNVDEQEDNQIVSIDNSCPKKCVCNPDNSIKCSGLTIDDFTPGMFSGGHLTKM